MLNEGCVLVVDDTAVNRMLLSGILRNNGYKTLEAENGWAAIETAHREDPHLILLDIMMPGIDGYETCKRLKQSKTTRDIPVVFITTKNELEDQIEGLSLGALDFIVKPAIKEILLPKVKTFVSLRQKELERRRAAASLRESETYLKTLMATIQTGIIITDVDTGRIADVNPFAADMIGFSKADLVGKKASEFILLGGRENQVLFQGTEYGLCTVRRSKGEAVQATRSTSKVKIKEREYLVQSLQDITDMIRLMEKQEMDIDMAKSIVGMVNNLPPRHIDFSDRISLFIGIVYAPCYAEGGDHYLIRTFPSGKRPARTVVSLKDQSGHEVSCVLKGIMTDLIHNAVLFGFPDMKLEETAARLNDELCFSGLFNKDDFFTAINLEIDHETLEMRYLSAGHPAFLVIRDNQIIDLPGKQDRGANFPMAVMDGLSFSAGEYQLEPGDRIILYTDGLTEMPMENQGLVISLEELKARVMKLLETQPQLPVSQLVDRLLSDISLECGEEIIPFHKNTAADDVTIIGLEIESRGGYSEVVSYPENEYQVSGVVDELCGLIAGEWRRRGYKNPEIRLRIVLEEAVNNAWVHGNKRTPGKSITIRWGYGNEAVVEVIDQGDGIGIKKIPNPTIGEKIAKPDGRGLFMIQNYSSSVRWRCRGRNLVMTFSPDPDNEPENYYNNSARFIKLWKN